MSATARLWKILRAEIGDRLRRRKGAPGGEHSGWRPRTRKADGESSAGTSAGSSAGRRQSSPPVRDPELERYYANLEVPYGSDLETVEKAWKRLMRKYHPDRHARDPERQQLADDLVKELNRAYGELRRRLEKKSA